MRVSEVDRGALIDSGQCFASALDDLLTHVWATGWQVGELSISSRDARRLLAWAETCEDAPRVEDVEEGTFGFKHPIDGQFIKVVIDPTLEVQSILLPLTTVK